MPHHNTISKHGHGTTVSTEGHTIRWSRFYDLSVNLLTLGTEKRLREAAIDLAQIQPGDRVLDVGCGTGSLTILAKKKAGLSGAVYGVDPAAEMIDVARTKAANEGIDVNFILGVAENLEFPNDDFDLVLSSLMVHHLPGDGLKSLAFAEMYRVLKPGSHLLIVDFEPPKNYFLRWLLRPFLKGMLDYDIRAIIPLLMEAGFTEIESGKTEHRLASYVSARKVQVY